MTNKSRAISPEFWTDKKVQTLPLTTRALVYYCFSSPHTTSLGCFRLPLEYAAADLKISKTDIFKGFKQAEQADLISYDKQSNWLFIPTFIKWNPVHNPNQWKHIHNLLATVPENLKFYHTLIRSLLEHISVIPKMERAAYEALLSKDKRMKNLESSTSIKELQS